jgi:hypothetical protein
MLRRRGSSLFLAANGLFAVAYMFISDGPAGGKLVAEADSLSLLFTQAGDALLLRLDQVFCSCGREQVFFCSCALLLFT